MKYVVLLGDGMSDYRKGELGNATPLELAKKPNMDFLASRGTVGLIQTVPAGMKPGSDIANLSVMGYNPKECYTGRSPLEAVSMGVVMFGKDVALRTNFVTLSSAESFGDRVMLDYSAGEITTEEAEELIYAVENELGDERFAFHSGVSYRNCLIDREGNLLTVLTPPHDISGKVIRDYLPKGGCGQDYLDLMERSVKILENHKINIARRKNNKNPANCIWFWGAGTKPALKPFYSKFRLKGAVISAVDLLKGIAICADMKVCNVPGATGNLDTNFAGKADAALKALREGCDYVYLHIEAPDECGHRGEAQNKITAIEKVDEVLGRIYEGLKASGENFVIAVLPDHATPLCLKTHTSDPVPFIVYKSFDERDSVLKYTEEEARNGIFLPSGEDLIKFMMKDAD